MSRDTEPGRPLRSVDAEGRVGILYELASAVGAELALDGLVGAMSAVLRRTFPHEFMDLVLPDDQGTLRVHALVKPEGLSAAPLQAGYTFPAAGSVQGDVIRERRLFVANTEAELEATPLRPEERALARQARLRAACVLPLVSRGRAIGSLGFLSTREGVFDDSSVGLLTQVAGQLAPAVDNALAYERLAALTEQLRKQKGYLEEEIRTEGNFEEIVGRSPALARVLEAIQTVAATDSTGADPGRDRHGQGAHRPPVPQRPLLPPERVPDHPAAAA